MVHQQINKLLFIVRIEQVIESSGGKCGKSRVGWGQQGERPHTLEGFCQPGGFDCSNKFCEVSGLAGSGDDVHFAGRRVVSTSCGSAVSFRRSAGNKTAALRH